MLCCGAQADWWCLLDGAFMLEFLVQIYNIKRRLSRGKGKIFNIFYSASIISLSEWGEMHETHEMHAVHEMHEMHEANEMHEMHEMHGANGANVLLNWVAPQAELALGNTVRKRTLGNAASRACSG